MMNRPIVIRRCISRVTTGMLLLAGLCMTVAQTPTVITSHDFENQTLGANLADCGWTKVYGNGSAAEWKIVAPGDTGNDSTKAVGIAGADAQLTRPFDSSNTLDDRDTDLCIEASVRGLRINGNTQPIRFTAADTSAHVGPFAGLYFDKSPGSDKYDLLRFAIDRNLSPDPVVIGHWYNMQLRIHVDPNHLMACKATLYVRDMTAGEKEFRIPTGLKDVTVDLNRSNKPSLWRTWWLRGSYGGQIDNLSLARFGEAHSAQTPTTPAPVQTVHPAAPLPQFPNPILAPIVHQRYWQGERELYNYQPKFTPNVVTFDHENRPYIRTGKWWWGGHPLYEHPDAVVQTLDDQGQWLRLDFQSAIKNVFPWWDGHFKTGPFGDERIVFDKSDTAYMIVEADRSSIGHTLLLVSKDHCRTWRVYTLPLGFAWMEFQDGHNQLDGPPPILIFNDTILRLVQPVEKPDGSLEIPNAAFISNDSSLPPDHSGGANSMETRDGKTFIVFPGATLIPNHKGTPQYICVFDHATGKVSEPKLLGFGQSAAPGIDNHCVPEIAIDSKGYLNVLFGAHHQQFQYTRSLEPLDINGWTDPAPFGEPRDKSGSYSYISLICDGQDTLHVVGRWAGAGYIFRLVYLRKKADQPWEKQKYLVVPFRGMYSCWYQKLNMDRRGRLFLNYIFYGNQLSQAEADAYRAKWPDEPISLPPNADVNRAPWYNGVNAHGPAMLMSDDGGDTWRLAATSDLLAGIKE